LSKEGGKYGEKGKNKKSSGEETGKEKKRKAGVKKG